MFRVLYFIFLLSISLNISFANSSRSDLLRCLAKEEQLLHKKKILDTRYNLNQQFITKISEIGDIILKPEYYKEVCLGNHQYPSLKLLKLLVLHGSSIYSMDLKNDDTSVKTLRINSMKEMDDTIIHLFIEYLSALRLRSKDAKCLENNIPYYKEVIIDIKFLEEEMSVRNIFKDTKKITAIFNSLDNFDKIVKKCDQELAERLKNSKYKRNSEINP